MKLLLSLFTLALVLMPFVVLAQNFGSPVPTAEVPTNVSQSELTTLNNWYLLIQDVIGWIFVIAIILGVIVLIIAGIIYITSAGSARAQLAGKMIIYAVVGIAVAALAWAIVNLVGNFFVGDTLIS